MQAPTDYERMAELSNTYRSEPVTADLVARRYREFPADGMQQHWMAVDESGYVLGWAFIRRMPTDKPGRIVTRTLVDPRFRREGVGSALLGTAEAGAREAGGAYMESDIRDNDPEGLSWARHRGFAIIDHVFESTLDLSAFDGDRFAEVVSDLELGGMRFCRLSDLPPGEESERKLYDLERLCAPDNPLHGDREFPPFEVWREQRLTQPNMPPEEIILAMYGSRVVAMTCVETTPETGARYTGFTCVHPEYRGRGLALAVKVVSIWRAKTLGCPLMRTHNDSRNGPMLAVNRKLGYVAVPGFYGLAKELTT
jgi:GNAT superfamily N-acetyltransferase